ncbi:hypothetical protein Bca4012_051103 [Brassica carinata]
MLFVLLFCEESYETVGKLSPETRSSRPYCHRVVTLLPVFENAAVVAGNQGINTWRTWTKKCWLKSVKNSIC